MKAYYHSQHLLYQHQLVMNRATIIDTVSGSIWNGSIQVYQSQSIDKPVYKNQIPLEGIYISNVTDNEYIILD